MKKMMMMALVALVSMGMTSCGNASKTQEQQTETTEETACCQQSECLLAGEWTIESAGEITAIEDMNKPALTIEDGKVNGQTGCNSFFGDVKCCPKSKKVAFSNIGATKMFCQDSDAQEQAILKALNEAASFTLEEGVATFMDAEGNALMVLKKL